MRNFKNTMVAIACATAFIGQYSVAATGDTVTMGDNSGQASVAIGPDSQASDIAGVALGNKSISTGLAAIAIGHSTAARGVYSTVIGQAASTSAFGDVAIGYRTSVQDRSVATSDTTSVRSSNFAPYNFGIPLTDEQSSQAAWTGGILEGKAPGTVAIGNNNFTRQLTGVAAGSQDNDAVNVAQLKSLKNYSDSTFTTASNTIFGEGASNVITPAVTGEDGNVTTEAVLAQNAVIMGNNAKVQMDNSVAIGANSIASTEGRTATVHLIPADADGAWKSEGLVSFGGTYQPVDEQGQPVGEPVNFNRQLTGVAAGSEDNDAVNVAQLKQLENNTATQLNSLMTGETKVSTVQLTAVNEDGTPVEGGPTIGLRYQVASEAAQADGDSGAPTVSQGRLVYNNMDATGAVYGTETIATLSDGIKLSGGSTFAASGAAVDSVDVSLNQGISFLGDEYLKTTVTEGENGGAVVTIGASEELKKFLVQSGVQPSEPTNPSNPGNSGNSGGTWTPNAAQQAALNGNFANGITVAAGEGNQAIQIKQGNVDMGGNRIQNVGNPINDGDAANKAYVDSTSRSLRNKINDVDKDLRAGVAMAMAVGNLPQAYMPGKSILAVSAGTYHGQGGFALGLSHATDNRQWVFKGAASVDTRGNFGGTLSAGYQF